MNNTIKAIETVYKGYRFRSRLEARWAVFFDALGVKWEYEKEGYDLGEAGWYLPDFWLPELQCWFEVKGEMNDEDADKIAALSLVKPVIVGRNLENDDNLLYDKDAYTQLPIVNCIYYAAMLALVDTHLSMPSTFPLRGLKLALLTAIRDIPMRKVTRDALQKAAGELGNEDAIETIRLCFPARKNIGTLGDYVRIIKDAYLAARQARFEHGEQPHIERN